MAEVLCLRMGLLSDMEQQPSKSVLQGWFCFQSVSTLTSCSQKKKERKFSHYPLTPTPMESRGKLSEKTFLELRSKTASLTTRLARHNDTSVPYPPDKRCSIFIRVEKIRLSIDDLSRRLDNLWSPFFQNVRRIKFHNSELHV